MTTASLSGGGMSDSLKLRPLARCGVPDAAKWDRLVCSEVRGLLAALAGAGVSMVDVGVSIGVGRRTLYRWRTGEDAIPAKKLLALRALAGERARKVGT